MAFRAVRGLDCSSSGQNGGRERSASPSWNEGRSSRNRVSQDWDMPPTGGLNNTPAGTGTPSTGSGAATPYSNGSWMPGGFEVGDFVTYVGPSYTFPGTGVTLRPGMDGEVVGHGANVPVEYRSHCFLGIRFFGHSGNTNVPPDALAPCFRPPTSGPWVGPGTPEMRAPAFAATMGASSPSSSRGAGGDWTETSRRPGSPMVGYSVAVVPAPRYEGGTDEQDCCDAACCAGPPPPRGEAGRPDRAGCDVVSFFDFLFGVGPGAEKSGAARAARSPALQAESAASVPMPCLAPESRRLEQLQMQQRLQRLQQQQRQPQTQNPQTHQAQTQQVETRLGDSVPACSMGAGSTTSFPGSQRRAG